MSEYNCGQSQAQENIEREHLHPSLITLSKDPFKSISISEYAKSRVVCASLEQDDHNIENENLKEEAVKKGQKRKEAYQNHALRVFHKHKDSDYNMLDISSLVTGKGAKKYF